MRILVAEQHAVPVEFKLPTGLPPGKAPVIVGSCEQLGAWKLDGGKQMTRMEGDVWQSTVELPAGQAVEYKYVLVEDGNGQAEWQKGANRAVSVESGVSALRITDGWERNGQHDVEAQLAQEAEAEAEDGAEPRVVLELSVQQALNFGSRLCLVGSSAALGAWDVGAALEMIWEEGNVWRASIKACAGEALEYKYVVITDNGAGKPSSVQWQEGAANRVLQVPPNAARVTVHEAWRAGSEPEVSVQLAKAQPSSRADRLRTDEPLVAQTEQPMLPTDEIEIVTPSGQILSGMNVRELKDQLRELGLDPTGRKVTLVHRLSEHLSHGASS
eukprot:jgi/Tetstr1/465198/TSEL_009905.t1